MRRKIFYPDHRRGGSAIVVMFKILIALTLTAAAAVFAFALSVGIEIAYIPQMAGTMSNTLLSVFVLGVIGTCVFYLLQRLHLAMIALVVALISLGVTLYFGDTIIRVYTKSDLARSIHGDAAAAQETAQ